MPSSIFQLVYVSKAVGAVDDPTLDSIKRAAHRFNQDREITGMLLAGRGLFLQLLEGPFNAVTMLLDGRIATDPRHIDLRVIHGAYATDRLFPSWSMGVLSMADEAMPVGAHQIGDELLELSRGPVDEAIPMTLLRRFERAVGQHDGRQQVA